MKINKNVLTNLTVWVAALGYFVDMFDITLFGVVRVESLKAIGITTSEEILNHGIYLYNMQMVGMMIGGLLWGFLSDKKGRLSVLFGSILLYSLGNIANAFVTTLDAYAFCRFITGLGLAGELGAAITLVVETLPQKDRGWGTTMVATLGLLGSVTAALIGQKMPWNYAYILGGVMGLGLLATRFQMRESEMFHKSRAKAESIFKTLVASDKFFKYIACILVGVPIYFMTGILFTFSPEIAKSLGVQGEVIAGNTLLYGTIGLTLGDLLSGLLSQVLKSRKKSLTVFISTALALTLVYILGGAYFTPEALYVLCFGLGICAGYWAVLITTSAEQFGTNVRGTVSTTVPNFVRGAAVFITLGFHHFKSFLSAPHAALSVAMICFVASLGSLYFLKETFHADLDYVEEK
ncbi:MAG: MFS transporter [Bdellovibrionales bacterium]|nr:MFS transporter [Bdellovibrionales bacterium]